MQTTAEAIPSPKSQQFGNLPDWQAMLDRASELFSEITPGAAVGFVPRSNSGIQPGKHVAGLGGYGNEIEMMKWTNDNSGMKASLLRYPGITDAGVDLLFVTNDEAIKVMQSTLGDDTLPLIKRLIRKGSIMFFVLRTKSELQDAGYEEFLDTLGLAFLGACR